MILAVNVSSINCLSIAYLSIECYYAFIHFFELHPINIRCWNVESLNWHLSGWNTLPAILKSPSTATDDTDIVRYSNASLFKLGKTFIFTSQYWRGSPLWSSVGWLQRARRNDPMLAYCYVIIDVVDPQLRQRLVFYECSTWRCTNRSPVFNNWGMSVDIEHNDLCVAKKYLFPFNVIVINCHYSAV